MIAYNGFEFHLEDIGLGRVGNVTVTDYDCSCCGEHVGVHAGRLCDHQRDLMAAMALHVAELDGQELSRWRKALAMMQECE